ncbi:hypothetical protein [Ruminococcus sp.]|uniref:hypothetical protein n=1 Tax=Ruminococcus sp. TaxID=41978 RepID=UPI0025D2CB4A|nr:hypothetical protein [Ruminococcus sp.]
MSEIRSVTIQKITLECGVLRKYIVEYNSGVVRTYGIPPENVEKFIKENFREISKVKYKFTAKE